MSGLAPTPTKLLEMRGSWRAKTRTDEPEAVGSLHRPAWLSAAGKKQWNHIAPLVEAMRIGSEVDSFSLATLCDSLAQYIEITQRINESGIIITDSATQSVKPNPLFQAQDAAWARVYKMAQQFGLTPASRAKVKVNPAGIVDDKQQFFKAV